MTPKIVIAYGRISTNRQSKPKEQMSKQKTSIKRKFPGCRLDFKVDLVGGHTRLSGRPKFLLQLMKAKDAGLPLVIEHSDRLLKTYEQSTILEFWQRTLWMGVELVYVIPNTAWHRKFERGVYRDVSRDAAIRRLSRRVAQYIVWRQATQNGKALNPAPAPLPKISTLKEKPGELAVLTKGAAHILSLSSIVEHPKRNFCLDSYLGRAYDELLEFRTAEGRKKSLQAGQRGYYEGPEDEKLFAALAKQIHKTRTTGDGRRIPLSNQRIADNMTKLGFRNRRDNALTWKNIRDRRQSLEFQEYLNPDTLHPALPDLKD